jgi:hypothetical protein
MTSQKKWTSSVKSKFILSLISSSHTRSSILQLIFLSMKNCESFALFSVKFLCVIDYNKSLTIRNFLTQFSGVCICYKWPKKSREEISGGELVWDSKCDNACRFLWPFLICDCRSTRRTEFYSRRCTKSLLTLRTTPHLSKKER